MSDRTTTLIERAAGDGALELADAALALLVNVPLAHDRDADAYVEIMTTAGRVLPKRQQSRTVSIARRYIANAIKGRPFAMAAA